MHGDHGYTDNGSTSMEDMELYTNNGSSSMEDMVDYHYDIDSSCMEDMELEDYLAMQEAAHSHQQAMTFPKSKAHSTMVLHRARAILHQAQEGSTSTRTAMHMLLNIMWLHKGDHNNKYSRA